MEIRFGKKIKKIKHSHRKVLLPLIFAKMVINNIPKYTKDCSSNNINITYNDKLM